MKNPLVPLRVVRCNPTDPDHAIDIKNPDTQLGKYVVTRDVENLRFLPDTNPTWFNVERLPQAFLTDVLDSVYPIAARRLLAFRAAIHVIDGPNGVYVTADDERLQAHPKGSAPKGAAFVCTEGDHGTDIAPLDFAQTITDEFGAEVIQELGQVAIDFARLPRKQKGPFSLWGGSVASA